LQRTKQTILVTGGAGFIGGNFVLDAVASGEIVNLDALTYAGNPETLSSVAENPDHIFVQGRIGERELVDRLLVEYRPSAVVNFAAETHVDRSIDGPKAFVQTNVVETQELLEAALSYWGALQGEEHDAFRFLHVSTDEVYGTLGPTGHFTEESPFRPNSPYAASKAASDHLVRAYPDHELLQQLRALPFPGEADTAHDPDRFTGRTLAGIR
jgi:dTDP-glucose 4,6-dehydratase